MPVITIEYSKITKEQKARLIKELVSKASEVLNVEEKEFVTIIKENDADNVGIGTLLLSERNKS